MTEQALRVVADTENEMVLMAERLNDFVERMAQDLPYNSCAKDWEYSEYFLKRAIVATAARQAMETLRKARQGMSAWRAIVEARSSEGAS